MEMNIYNKPRNLILLWLESFLFFFYFYKADLAFLGIPSTLHSIRLLAFFYLIYSLFTSGKVFNKATYPARNLFKVIKVNLFLLFYCFLIIFAIGRGDGHNITDDIINQLIFGFLMIWPLSKVFKSADHFMNVLLNVHIIQSVIIWLTIINPVFMIILDNTVNPSEWYLEQRGSYAGGIGCITSSGAVKFAFGLVACIYKYYKKPGVKYIALYTFLSITICMIARTGLILSAVGLLFLLLGSKDQKINSKILIVSIVVITGLWGISGIDKNSSFYNEHFRRFERFEEEDGLVSWVTDAYLGNKTSDIPPLSAETMIGTTVTSGVSGNGVRVNVDGGFIRNYVAFGLPLAIFFYFFTFWNCFRVAIHFKDDNRKVLLFTLIILLIGEFKEPYIFTIIPWTTFYLIAIKCAENERRSIIKFR